MFNILSFKEYLLESQAGYKSAKKKRDDASKRAADMNTRESKNKLKYEMYDEKMKYETEHTKLQGDIETEKDRERKEALKKEMKKLNKQWKEVEKKLKARIKAI